MRDKPITHTDRAIHDDIRGLARYMRTNPTPAEQMLWQFIRKNQIRGFRFRRQFAVERFIVDFYCPEARLVIEIDGAIHGQPGHVDYDKKRQLHLESLGLRVLRFTNAQVMDGADTVAEVIGDWLGQNATSRAAEPGKN